MGNVLFGGFLQLSFLVFSVYKNLKSNRYPLFLAIFPDLEMLHFRFVNYICHVCKWYCYFGHFRNFGQYLYLHIFSFWPCREKYLIRNIRLISKFMTSQPGWQTITIHIFSSISRSKGNQTMKFDQLTKYNKRNIFL